MVLYDGGVNVHTPIVPPIAPSNISPILETKNAGFSERGSSPLLSTASETAANFKRDLESLYKDAGSIRYLWHHLRMCAHNLHRRR